MVDQGPAPACDITPEAPAGRPVTPPSPGEQAVTATPAAVKRSMPMALSIMLGILLAAAGGLFFYRLTWFILIFYLSVVAATVLEAPVGWMVHKGIRRGIASVIIMLGGLALLGTALFFIANKVFDQAHALTSTLENAPKRINDFVHHLPGIGKRLADFDVAKVASDAAPSLTAVVSNAMSVVEVVTWLVLMFFIILYMLIDGPDHLKTIRCLLPKHRRFDATRLFTDLSKAHRGWAFASAANVCSSTLLTGTGLFFIGVPAAYLLGFIAGLGEIIPNIGPLAASAPAFLVTLVAAPDKILWVVGMFLVVWTIQGYTISPLMMKFSVELPVLVTILAILVFGTLFGFLGILISIPLVADMVVIWNFHGQRREKDVTDYDAINDPPDARRLPMSPDNTPPSTLARLFHRDRPHLTPAESPAADTPHAGLDKLDAAERRTTNPNP